MPTDEKNRANASPKPGVKDTAPASIPPGAQGAGANESTVSRIESGGTGSSAGESGVDPNRLKGD